MTLVKQDYRQGNAITAIRVLREWGFSLSDYTLRVYDGFLPSRRGLTTERYKYLVYTQEDLQLLAWILSLRRLGLPARTIKAWFRNPDPTIILHRIAELLRAIDDVKRRLVQFAPGLEDALRDPLNTPPSNS